ncbi:MAG TPA: HNH endonuclease [Cyclobacteriaceae bacterium]|jgi:hypothetical protein|nr:HNH endonuclease [Cyclobacteriaceae bacterium]
MAKTKSDISNSAIRIFLQKVGEFYDKTRGFEKFTPTKKQAMELLVYFNNKCCYCGEEITLKDYSQDHIIPMNKEHLGLHAWGNVIPCCRRCNNAKQQKNWEPFLKQKSDEKEFNQRKSLITLFIKEKKYDPALDLNKIAGNLYEDIGEVAMTLINLRYKQAEEVIQKLQS